MSTDLSLQTAEITEPADMFGEAALLGQTKAVVSYDPAAFPENATDAGFDQWQNRRNPETFEPFPLDCLPPIVTEYVEQATRALNQNPAGLAMVLLTQAGGLVGAAKQLRLGSGWFASPILWTALIGSSGGHKSPILKAAPSLLVAKEAALVAEYEHAKRRYERAVLAYERAVKRGEITLPEEPTEPVRRKLFISSATIEGLVKYVHYNPRGAMLAYDELSGWFGDLTRNNGAAAATWLSGHNGAPVNSVRAVAEETSVARAYWGLSGGITPDEFHYLIGRSGRLTNGTLSRFCLVWPPELSLDEMTFTDSLEITAAFPVRKILELLADLPFDENDPKRIIALDAESRNRWQCWRAEITEQRLNARSDIEGSLFSKTEETAGRIALILHVLEAAERHYTSGLCTGNAPLAIPAEIPVETLEKALTLTRWILDETLYCYGKLGLVGGNGTALDDKAVLSLLENSALTRREIGRKIGRFRSAAGAADLEAIIERLVATGQITKQESVSANGKAVIRYTACGAAGTSQKIKSYLPK